MSKADFGEVPQEHAPISGLGVVVLVVVLVLPSGSFFRNPLAFLAVLITGLA
jgi:hypothetical protein